MARLGIDIGGANLKLADGEGHAETAPFPLWQQKDELAGAVRRLIGGMPAHVDLAVTMTGELADCFATKAEGVESIVRAVEEAADGRGISVYTTMGTFVLPEEAVERPMKVASANWHALATFTGRYVPDGPGLAIDVGSTTTDLIPLIDGCAANVGQTDPERLASGELVYTGVRRTPVCAITASGPWREHRQVPLAAELFATSWDVYLTLGDMVEGPAHAETADGRPATREAARSRLARMVCADESMFDADDARQFALAVEKAQLGKLGVAAQQVLRRMPAAPRRIVISGAGEFLARKLIAKLRLDCGVVSLSEQLGEQISHAACAHAVAVLAAEADQ